MGKRLAWFMVLGLMFVLTMVFIVGDAYARVTVPAGQPDAVRQPRPIKFKSLKPTCPAGYEFNGNTCVQYSLNQCRKTGCNWREDLGRCNGPTCAARKPCGSAWEQTPVKINGEWMCRRTKTPTCPAGSTWDRMTKKCKPQELRRPK